MVLVLKIGGKCINDGSDYIADTVEELMRQDTLIIVHGYGSELTRILQENNISREAFTSLSGINSHFTDQLCTAASVFAAANCRAQLTQTLTTPERQIYENYAYANQLVLGKRKNKIRYLDDKGIMRVNTRDFSGSITEINFNALFLEQHNLIILSPIIADTETGELLVIDADKLAVEIASCTNAKDLILLSDVPGLRVNEKYRNSVSFNELGDLIKVTDEGMQRKLLHIRTALQNGVTRALIMDGTGKTSPENNGTVFHAEG